MKHHGTVEKWGVFLGALLFVAVGVAQAQTKAAASGTATFTVTAVGKKEATPPISKGSSWLSRQPRTLRWDTSATTQRKWRRISLPIMNWLPKHFAFPLAYRRLAPAPTWEPWTCSSVGRKPARDAPSF